MTNHQVIVQAFIAHATVLTLIHGSEPSKKNAEEILKGIPEIFALSIRLAETADRENIQREARR